jgi:hypothetical protein
MTQVTHPTATTSRELAAETALHFATDRRRWLQLALAAIWVFDGILQFQTFMFTKSFAKEVLVGSADGSPHWIADSVIWSARIVESNPVLINAVFATLQLAIGLGIAWRRSLRAALAVSIGWSLIVWWFGESAGGLSSGGASPLAGAPGAVLLYLILAVVLWPTRRPTVGAFVAAQPIGPRAAKAVWFVIWVGLAALNLQPANLTAGGVHDMVDGMGDGQPGWLKALLDIFTDLSAHNGIPFTIIGTVILALIAFGIFLPRSVVKVVVIAAVVVSAFIWVIGEALGSVFGGQSTDVNSGPLLALIALAYWPLPASTATHVPDTEGVGK